MPLAGKFAGAFIGTYVTRIDAPFALATGLMSKGVAEIAFLLVLLELGVIPKDDLLAAGADRCSGTSCSCRP